MSTPVKKPHLRPDLMEEFEAWMRTCNIPSKVEAARRLGVNYTALHALLAGKSSAKMPRLRMLALLVGVESPKEWNDTRQDWPSLIRWLKEKSARADFSEETTTCQTL